MAQKQVQRIKTTPTIELHTSGIEPITRHFNGLKPTVPKRRKVLAVVH